MAYTTCFDAVVAQLRKINSTIVPVGPEISGSCSYPGSQFEYLSHVMNKSNHVDDFEPQIGSYHIGINGDGLRMPGSAEAMYTQWDGALGGFVPAADKLLVDLKSPAALILNEFVNSVQDWCEKPNKHAKSVCPDWQKKSTSGGNPDLTKGKGVKMNRQAWAWNAAAGTFAYAFGTLAERDYLLVGHDQLVAGTWPDNEPTVAMLDWTTGEPNAKYYVTQLLASTVGAAAEKALYSYKATSAAGNASAVAATLYVLPFRFTFVGGGRGVLLVNKRAHAIKVTLAGGITGTAKVVEVAPAYAGGAGFQPPVERSLSAAGEIELCPFAVAVAVDLRTDDDAGATYLTYKCLNATDQPTAPNIVLLSNLTEESQCAARCTANAKCTSYVTGDCSIGSKWYKQSGGAKPCDIPKGKFLCWLKSSIAGGQEGQGCRRLCVNGRTPPPPPAAKSFVCAAAKCVPGTGRVSYLDPKCYGQCKTDDDPAH